jgi:hypothetical protein
MTRQHLPLPVLAAAVLAVEGVAFVTVGSTAMWLHGLRTPIGDLDIVPAPDLPNLCSLRRGLGSIGVPLSLVPPASTLAAVDVVPIESGFGAIDLLCGRGRADYGVLATRSQSFTVADSAVPVASLNDVLYLRRRFKDGPIDE